MELSKKTTILFPPDLHAHLLDVARQRGTSLGHLVRLACELQYGYGSPEARMEAAKAIGAMSLPVSTPQAMKLESIGYSEEPVT